jgi:hypothetical protein
MPSSALIKMTSPGIVDPSPQGHAPPFETTADMKAVRLQFVLDQFKGATSEVAKNQTLGVKQLTRECMHEV